MWQIQLSTEPYQRSLPMITSQSFIVLALGLVGLRICIQYLLEQGFNIRTVRKEHSSTNLQFSYFYHLSIIILGFSELNWNLFDLCIWVFSYVCVGMFRKAIYTINIQREFLINDYSYNNQIVRLLINSIKLSIISGTLATFYIFFVNVAFLGVMYKVISILCFPSIMLIVDSVFLGIVSFLTQQHMVYFYNQNINGVSPLYKVDLYYKIVRNALKCSHFFNLFLLCSSIIYNKSDFLDCLWIVTVLGAFYQSALQMIKSVYKYKKTQKLVRSIDRIVAKVRRVSDQVCIICMQPLLNSHRLVQCGHLFHYKCLFQWIQTKEQCPICRVRINLDL